MAIAFHPLFLAELGTALTLPRAIDQDVGDAAKDFVQYAGDFLQIVVPKLKNGKDFRTVVPSHSSLSEFVLKIEGFDQELAPFRLQVIECHQSVAKRALDYTLEIYHKDLEIEVPHPLDFKKREKYHDKHPLFHYALMTSLRHLLHGSTGNPDLSHPLFDTKDLAHQKWLQGQCYAIEDFKCNHVITIIRLAALLGHTDILHYCPNKDVANIDVLDGYQRAPLFYGLTRGCGDVVKMLLD